MERILELWATVLAWYHDPFTATAQLLEGIRDNLPLTHRVLAGACHLLSAARDALTGPTRTVPAASDEWVGLLQTMRVLPHPHGRDLQDSRPISDGEWQAASVYCTVVFRRTAK